MPRNVSEMYLKIRIMQDILFTIIPTIKTCVTPVPFV